MLSGIPEPEASSSLWRFYQTEMCGSRAKIQEGTTHIVFELIKDNQVVSHASVAVTVKDGAAPGGLSTRNYANW